MQTYIIDVWQEESIWTWKGEAASEEIAQNFACEELNHDWERCYPSWDELAADMDGTATRTEDPLFAAAPAMLAALRDAADEIDAWRRKFHPQEWPDKPIIHTATRDKVRAAIAAATGPSGELPGWLRVAESGEDKGPSLTLDNMGQEFTCTACGREESECSAEPCPDVIEDRGEATEEQEIAAFQLVAQISRMILTGDADGADLGNDDAMDRIIRRAREIVAGKAD